LTDLPRQLQEGLSGRYALEPLLTLPYHLSPGWLRIDPAFASLKGNPRFEKLAAGN
jgi:hypothetical protein